MPITINQMKPKQTLVSPEPPIGSPQKLNCSQPIPWIQCPPIFTPIGWADLAECLVDQKTWWTATWLENGQRSKAQDSNRTRPPNFQELFLIVLGRSPTSFRVNRQVELECWFQVLSFGENPENGISWLGWQENRLLRQYWPNRYKIWMAAGWDLDATPHKFSQA